MNEQIGIRETRGSRARSPRVSIPCDQKDEMMMERPMIGYLPHLLLVFTGGFAVMVLEIVGARFLAKDFGGSFYVWVSQIGVILTALALGYYVGGTLADRFLRASTLAGLLVAAGVFTWFIPDFADSILGAIVARHPLDRAIPLFWQKVDPAIGSALVFLFPCGVLATVCPYMIRLAAHNLAHVGRISGGMYAASTVGSIAGVFVSGYILIDHMSLSVIFRATGGWTILMGLFCLAIDRQLKNGSRSAIESLDRK